jgi:colanic acid biosynthesis glycosyl transferase WcaI
LRILIHGINYTPEVAGVGKYTGEMGEWLAQRGHEVRVVTTPPYYPAWRVDKAYSARAYRRERMVGTEVWRCPLWVPSKPSGIKRLLHLASFAASSFPVMLRQVLWRPNVVVLVVPTLFAAPQAWLAARLCRAGTWLHIQDFEMDAAMGLGILGGNRIRRFLHEVETFILARFSRVSAITEAMRRRVVEKGFPEKRALVFTNWSDVDSVRPLPCDNELRPEFGAGPEDVLVLYAGSMGEKQGLELVLDAADRLRERAEIKFALVGAGATQGLLERAARERRLKNVHFFPLQPPERLPLMLAAGDIHLVVQKRGAADLVMPSKLANILAAGRPSVVTADPGTALHNVLNEHDCGLTTASGSVEELTAAIVKLADDARMRERLGRNARRYAESHLDKDRILSDFESKLQELVEEGV